MDSSISRNIFWGLVIKPGKRYETEVREAFRVTKVSSTHAMAVKYLIY